MSTLEIIITILSSSIVTAILTNVVTLRMNNLNYKRDFYKKIIDKRINALEENIKLSEELKVSILLDDGKLCNMIFASGYEYFEQISVNIANTTNAFWVSSELLRIKQELNVFILNEIFHELDKVGEINKNENLITLGLKYHETIRNYRSKMEMQINKDLKNISNVKKFISKNDKQSNKQYHFKKSNKYLE